MEVIFNGDLFNDEDQDHFLDLITLSDLLLRADLDL